MELAMPPAFFSIVPIKLDLLYALTRMWRPFRKRIRGLQKLGKEIVRQRLEVVHLGKVHNEIGKVYRRFQIQFLSQPVSGNFNTFK